MRIQNTTLVPTLRVGTHAPDALRPARYAVAKVPLVPTLRVGTRAPDALRPARHAVEMVPIACVFDDGTRSVPACVPTRSVGTRRNAFTLIELMVAMALTIFVMTILTQAFVLSIDTFSGLKGIGDMQENLRAGANAMRYDLSQFHLEGVRRASDPNLSQLATTTIGSTTVTMGISTAGIYAGMTVTGGGILPNTQVAAVVSNTSITITNPATATNTGVINFSQQIREGFVAVYNGGTFALSAGSNQIVMPGFLNGNPVGMLVVPVPANALPAPTTVTNYSFVGGVTTLTLSAAANITYGQVPIALTMLEGADLDTMPSSRSSVSMLHMACRLRGNQQQSFYSTLVTDPTSPLNGGVAKPFGLFYNATTLYNMDPTANFQVPADATLNKNYGQFYRAQWAEVAYFLVLQGTTEEPLVPPAGVPPTYGGMQSSPLFGLYRMQVGMVTDASQINQSFKNYFAMPGTSIAPFQGMACTQNGNDLVFFSPNDLAAGAGTRTFQPFNYFFNPALTPSPPSASLVVPNVLSFQVLPIVSGSPQVLNYDSFNATQPLQGLFITLRVWDNKTRQTRQTSIIQDL